MSRKRLSNLIHFPVVFFSCLFFFSFATYSVADNHAPDSIVLSETEIDDRLETLPGWTTDGKEISRTFEFEDFVTAIDFVNRLVEPAESAGHHPDLIVSYNKVTVNLSTHDAGGLTPIDFTLAEEISQLAN